MHDNDNIFTVKLNTEYKNLCAKEEGNIVPSFNSIKSIIYRKIRKNLPKDIKSLEEIPNESAYLKTAEGNDFLIDKNNNCAIFLSKMQTKLMSENDNYIFIDGTFLVSPKCSYQLIVTRISLDKFKYYFSTSYSLTNDKKEKTYIDIF